MIKTRLFVIRKRKTDQFWNSSTEHGTGWNDGYPKQAFSPSELTEQIRLLVDNDWLTGCEILELSIAEEKSKIPTTEVTLNSEVDFTLTGQSLLKLWYSMPGPTIPRDWWVDIPDRSYQMCKYTVSEGLYRLYCEDQGVSREAGANPYLPVVNVSFEDAQRFAAWLSKKDGIKVRLPTEDEWEYCCRAGSKGAYCFGDDVSLLGDYAWYSENSEGVVHAPGVNKPNAWGLYDMHGNVWEWCDSWYDKRKDTRVLRGGAFLNLADYARAAYRNVSRPVYRWLNVGFRLIRDR